MTPNSALGTALVRGQSLAPSPVTHHAAASAAGGRLRTGGNGWAAPPPLPRGEDALRNSGVSTREGCASSSSKKRTLFLLSIFFFPSGLNPLLERDISISRETGSLCSQGLSQLPLSFYRGSLSSKAEAAVSGGVFGSQGRPRPGALQVPCALRQRVLVSELKPGPPQDLCEPAQPWRAHTGVITKTSHAQKSLITETDSCSLL